VDSPLDRIHYFDIRHSLFDIRYSLFQSFFYNQNGGSRAETGRGRLGHCTYETSSLCRKIKGAPIVLVAVLVVEIERSTTASRTNRWFWIFFNVIPISATILLTCKMKITNYKIFVTVYGFRGSGFKCGGIRYRKPFLGRK